MSQINRSHTYQKRSRALEAGNSTSMSVSCSQSRPVSMNSSLVCFEWHVDYQFAMDATDCLSFLFCVTRKPILIFPTLDGDKLGISCLWMQSCLSDTIGNLAPNSMIGLPIPADILGGAVRRQPMRHSATKTPACRRCLRKGSGRSAIQGQALRNSNGGSDFDRHELNGSKSGREFTGSHRNS